MFGGDVWDANESSLRALWQMIWRKLIFWVFHPANPLRGRNGGYHPNAPAFAGVFLFLGAPLYHLTIQLNWCIRS
jgi:hypothetical protein